MPGSWCYFEFVLQKAGCPDWCTKEWRGIHPGLSFLPDSSSAQGICWEDSEPESDSFLFPPIDTSYSTLKNTQTKKVVQMHTLLFVLGSAPSGCSQGFINGWQMTQKPRYQWWTLWMWGPACCAAHKGTEYNTSFQGCYVNSRKQIQVQEEN
jgi:hypothetical protein